jgi:hypothetical protein
MDFPATAGSLSLGTARLALCCVIAMASMEKDAPIARTEQPPELGTVVGLAEVGELQHRYKRRAA